jgi:hypothetical protein
MTREKLSEIKHQLPLKFIVRNRTLYEIGPEEEEGPSSDIKENKSPFSDFTSLKDITPSFACFGNTTPSFACSGNTTSTFSGFGNTMPLSGTPLQ